MLPEVSERITVAVIDGGFADLQCACDLLSGNSGELAREDRDVLFAAMRLCKIQAAGESEPVNQALRHRPVVGQILFFDLLMYGLVRRWAFVARWTVRKRKLRTGRASGVSSSAC